MSFAAMETSIDDSRPVELFLITYSGASWRYTSAAQAITLDGFTFEPIPCSASEIEQEIGASKNGLSFTFPHDVAFSDLFRIQPPSEVVSMTMYVQHMSSPGDYVVAWKGRIVNCDWKFPWVELITETIVSSLRRVGVRRTYGTACPYPLYSTKCGVSRDTYRLNGPILTLGDLSLTLPVAIGLPDNYFAGGLLTWTKAGMPSPESRMVMTSNGTTGLITFSAPTLGLLVGQDVSVYAGCDHSISTCSTKFNNKDNYGGFPYIPTINPFTGATLY